MPKLTVHVKHAGKVHDLPLDPDVPPGVFKQSVYEVTGVPVDRMKVMIKGALLKDDSDWKSIKPKPGQTIMVIGSAGELPKPPPKPVVFLEDMDESQLAEALSFPVGLVNLGNTCYMNATMQVMRSIPELQTSLSSFTPALAQGEGNASLTAALRDMYGDMSKTTDAYTPAAFVRALRQAVPQFGEMTSVGKSMSGYAQQDAEECWVQVTNALKALPGVPGGDSTSTGPTKRFVEQFMMGEMRRELKCDEAPEEPPTYNYERVSKIECNISSTTSFLTSGVLSALDQKIEKTSSSLGRQAVYTQTSRLTRIPANLTVHIVRFAWKRDIGKKAKVMRRVKFPLEFDVLDLCTDELKAKLLPANEKLKEFERDRAERQKVRRRTKVAQAPVTEATRTKDVEMIDAAGSGPVSVPIATPAGAEPPSPTGLRTGAALPSDVKGKGVASNVLELEDESVYRQRELQELEALIPEDVRNDVGCSPTGLYELIGIVTHKGAEADSGHYIGFVKKSAFYPVKYLGSAEEAAKAGALDESDEDWFKFDDEKVSLFPKEKISTLEGGGEDAAAYVLLYRSKSLA